MKHSCILCLFLLLFLSFLGCKESEADKRKKSIEMMTTQTLGLAYLEEFKLEEAEKEFLKMIELAPNDKLGYANLGLVYLRMGKYKDAEVRLLQAIEIDPEDADIRLLLSTVYQMDDRRDEAIAVLQEALDIEADHVKVLYDLAELYSGGNQEKDLALRKTYLEKLVAAAPENIVPQLQLTELLIAEGNADQAIERLEILQKQFPEFPKEAQAYFGHTIDLLRIPDLDKAMINFTIFHNYLKVSFPYQSGINDLKGPGGSLIGFPLITYNQQVNNQSMDDRPILEVIQFTDITETMGLDLVPINESVSSAHAGSTHLKTADYNGDGKTDIYVGSYDASKDQYAHYLFEHTSNGFVDIAAQVGLDHKETEKGAVFADYDNDGYLDLYVNSDKGSLLYRNADQGIFLNTTASSGINGAGVEKALFFDMDQDGDLDLFEAAATGIRVFRNNGDGSFVNKAAEMGFSETGQHHINDAAFGDFDDDGDIDLITVGGAGANQLYTNNRQGHFKVMPDAGLELGTDNNAVAVGDYNNDGFLDVFIASSEGAQSTLNVNQSNGKFEAVPAISELLPGIDGIHVLDAEFFDFDNDGFQDLLLVGEAIDSKGSGLILYHNDRNGGFENMSNLLPENAYNKICDLAVPDIDGDGDRDILLALCDGGVRLLRNDGGNLNHYVNMKLVGLRTGSAKNNYFGIGAKVELRAGDLYQSMVVTDPSIYFGLGNRSKADIIRITWTNGVPQNILLPDADQDLIESQTLKGSCPFLYTWNGEKYAFVKDITWRSALGMPLGIMGGTTQYAFAAASDDYIKIEAEQLKEKDGIYSLQITSELWETIYMDKIALIAVDHPEEIAIYVPEQFTPPPFPGMKLFQVGKKFAPVSATDEQGKNLLPMILEKDDRYISNLTPLKYQGITKMHDLILDPGTLGNAENLHMFLRGWIFPTDASINVALSQSAQLKLQFPVVQVINSSGQWQDVQTEMSFPMGKDKTVIVSLRDKFLSKDRRIRIRTNMEIYWDEIFFADIKEDSQLLTQSIPVIKADLHYRGFSATYRKGGRYGPHWFDYDSVDTSKKWRDLTGNYTRYGEVKPLLFEADNQYVISNAGDEMSLEFDASALPQLKKGWKRDFLIHSVGWVKDGDFNTAAGHTVEPLPYHGMPAYPPAKDENYPLDPGLKSYQEEYNTRLVSHEDFQNAIKPTHRSEE